MTYIEKNYRLEREVGRLDDKVDHLERQLEEYYKLLYAVETKYPNETRHQTALRYIQQAERIDQSVASKEESK